MDIAIIGGGNIGSRHLQAVARIDKPLNIFVVDPSVSSRDLAVERFHEIDKSGIHELKMLEKIDQLPKKIEIVIVATNSVIRRQIVEELLDNSTVNYLILEKFLFTSLEDFDHIGALLKKRNIVTYTDCTRRVMKCYKELKDELKDASYVDMSVTGGNWGLGCNGIHMLDLFAFITDDDTFCVDVNMLDDRIYESKRKGYIEFCGRLTLKNKKGMLSLTSFSDNNAPISMTIQSDRADIIISERKGKMVLSKLGENDKVETKDIDVLPTSVTTTVAVEDLIREGKCDLPTYEENTKLEKILLQAFLEKMNSITGEDNTVCQIT